MFEVPLAGKDHCDAVFIGGGNHFIVFLRAADGTMPYTHLGAFLNVSSAKIQSLRLEPQVLFQ